MRRGRLYATLLALGASVLLTRTLFLLSGGALSFFMAWVSALLIAEAAVDAVALAGSIRWWVTGTERGARFALRAAAAAALLHAFRVLVFVLGRTGPWVDFDVRLSERAMHSERWNWAEVYFAAAMATLGVIGVVVIWRLRVRWLKAIESSSGA